MAQEVFIKKLREDDKIEGFDLSKGPLVRLIILKLSENNFYLIWSNHHIIIDGWSTNLVFKDFFDLCNFKRSDCGLFA